MCMPKTPEIPAQPERQAAKLPESGTTGGGGGDDPRRRRAIIAGMMTSPSGLGAPTVSRPTLG